MALNRLRNAFLAAKNGEEVNELINGLLTQDEKMKIGRRILVAEYIRDGRKFEEIRDELKVGKNTIVSVINSLETHPVTFDLLDKRHSKVEHEYRKRKSRNVGGSKLVHKMKMYTGFKRKQVER